MNNYTAYLNESDRKCASLRTQVDKLQNELDLVQKRNDDLEYKVDEFEAEVETYKHVFREEQ